MQEFEKMPFNYAIVGALEKLLERAKKGRMSFFAYSFCEGPHFNEDAYLGDVSNFHSGHYGLVHCAKRLMESLDRLVSRENLAAHGNLYRYDITDYPINHDFFVWLVTVIMMQRDEGISGPTKICFVKHKGENVNYVGMDEEYRRGFIDSVMTPALKLFDIEVTEEAKEGRLVPRFACRNIVEMANAGREVPRIKVPETLMADMTRNLAGKEPVTITLREHKHWTHRNSNLTDWLKFAEYLEARGEHVIFVRDYAKAEEEITGFETMPAASKDFLVRAALYEHAKCNFFVSNGSATLALFGSRPWLQFILCDEGEFYVQNTPQWWWLNHGIARGDQFPWSAPNQRIIWEADTFEAMVKAWEETFPAAMAEAAE